MRTALTMLALALLVGCAPKDEDEDGWTEDLDCDDLDAAINPGTYEICNGIDDDCDGLIDEDPADGSTFYADADGDGWGDNWEWVVACEVPEGYTVQFGDCDDESTAHYPGAPEDDCTDPEDYNCDGSSGYADADGDGFPACEDCDDSERAVNPLAYEICDGVDNDCSSQIDGADALDAVPWYADSDGDGFGDSATARDACEAPDEGWVLRGEDCDDTQAEAFPGADELCNGLDDDCDYEVDDHAVDATTWYQDRDGDGSGDSRYSQTACEAPAGYVDDGSDCDDLDATAWPGGTEVCDGADNDCNGDVDDDPIDPVTFYADADADGYGDADSTTTGCEAPSGYAALGTDCDDSDDSANPGADEVCDEVDNDCDGDIDEDDALDVSTFFLDLDSDGYGDSRYTTEACDAPSGYADNDGDCDDLDDEAYGGLGDDSSDPAISCKALLACDSSASDGMVHLDPDLDGTAIPGFCDMSTDGGGWTLLTWTGDSTSSPTGAPYPGVDYCADLDCEVGSAMEQDDLEALFDLSSELAVGQSPDATLDSYQLLEDYDNAGAYDYSSLSGLTVAYSSDDCDDGGFATGTFRALVGTTAYDGTEVFLAPELRMATCSYSSSSAYVWSVGVIDDFCDDSGDEPGTMLGSFSAYQDGPLDENETGAYSVWVR